MKLDILAIGVHPDDIELACGGTLLHHAALGHATGVLDLTLGQLGTRGTPEIRLQEAEASAKILGLKVRENAGMEDGYFQNDKAHQLQVIKYLRRYKPDVVLANALKDRHPDHIRAGKLISDACFYAGLQKIETEWEGEKQEAWRPRNVYHYVQARHVTPDFVVDITPYMETKMKAVMAFKSQFYNPDSEEKNTFISSPEFLDFIKSRSIEYGTIVGVRYAEGFTTQRYLGIRDITQLY